MFDKGCTFLIIFGMPGKKHEDEPTRALKAADNIMKDFHTKNLEASIGGYSYYFYNYQVSTNFKIEHITTNVITCNILSGITTK